MYQFLFPLAIPVSLNSYPTHIIFFLIFANVIGIEYAIYITNVAEHTYLLAILYVPFDIYFLFLLLLPICKFLND